ncbi:MAG: hypothetical protein Q8R79_03855 [Legionellaceae bacterium]|nr:hypothetical protein [Legionellaceae bacterium]
MRWSIFMPGFYGIPFDSSFPENIFTDDLRKSAFTENPTIIPEIDCVCGYYQAEQQFSVMMLMGLKERLITEMI